MTPRDCRRTIARRRACAHPPHADAPPPPPNYLPARPPLPPRAAWPEFSCDAVRSLEARGVRLVSPLLRRCAPRPPPAAPRTPRTPALRLAVVIPWTNRCPCHGIPPSEWTAAGASRSLRLSPFFSYWAASAGANAALADFLVVHEPSLREAVARLRPLAPENVRWVEVQSLDERYRQKLNVTIPIHVENQKDLKPTIGLVFEEELRGYSHWAFGDMDVMYGDLSAALHPAVTAGRAVVSLVAAERLPSGAWTRHACLREGTVFAGQLTVFRNERWVAELFTAVAGWRAVLSDPTKRRLTFFDERLFATRVLQVAPREVSLVAAQLTDQFHTLDGRRVGCVAHESALLHLVGAKYRVFRSDSSGWSSAAVPREGQRSAPPRAMALDFPLTGRGWRPLNASALRRIAECPCGQRDTPRANESTPPPAEHREGVFLVHNCSLTVAPPPRGVSPPPAVRHAGMAHLPIWFALPSLDEFRRARLPCERKQRDFSPLVPRDKRAGMGMQHIFAAYEYHNESEYYRQYAESFFAITRAKAGLDSLRHYEILASGAAPFFLKLDELDRRPLSMLPFPARFVREIMTQPGVPSEARVLSAIASSPSTGAAAAALRLGADFNATRHCELQQQLLRYTDRFLTTATLASYFLQQLQAAVGISPDEARVLIFTPPSVTGESWQAAFLYHGLRLRLGERMSSWAGRKRALYADFPPPPPRPRTRREVSSQLYGFGHSWARRLPTPQLYSRCSKEAADELMHLLLLRRLEEGYFNVILVTTCSNRQCDLRGCYGVSAASAIRDYLRRNRATTAVATVDGNDVHGEVASPCHTTFADQLPWVDLHFLREVDPNSPPPLGRTAKAVRMGDGVPDEWRRQRDIRQNELY
ncbi:hypothetical protein AB1Y20_001818 [Prymnesium parvum]|uniref:Uncharacterized protein n=1 Tax=Prymnesium parvum TaxID=97485 RepID=A0AB34KCG4_PRYPA